MILTRASNPPRPSPSPGFVSDNWLPRSRGPWILSCRHRSWPHALTAPSRCRFIPAQRTGLSRQLSKFSLAFHKNSFFGDKHILKGYDCFSSYSSKGWFACINPLSPFPMVVVLLVTEFYCGNKSVNQYCTLHSIVSWTPINSTLLLLYQFVTFIL